MCEYWCSILSVPFILHGDNGNFISQSHCFTHSHIFISFNLVHAIKSSGEYFQTPTELKYDVAKNVPDFRRVNIIVSATYDYIFAPVASNDYVMVFYFFHNFFFVIPYEYCKRLYRVHV